MYKQQRRQKDGGSGTCINYKSPPPRVMTKVCEHPCEAATRILQWLAIIHLVWMLQALIFLISIIMFPRGDQTNAEPRWSSRLERRRLPQCSFTAEHLPYPGAVQLCIMTEPPSQTALLIRMALHIALFISSAVVSRDGPRLMTSTLQYGAPA